MSPWMAAFLATQAVQVMQAYALRASGLLGVAVLLAGPTVGLTVMLGLAWFVTGMSYAGFTAAACAGFGAQFFGGRLFASRAPKRAPEENR